MTGLSLETLRNLAAAELDQLAQEGRQVEALHTLYAQAESGDEALAEEALEEFWRLAPEVPQWPDYLYTEPTAWDEIIAACPRFPAQPALLPEQSSLHDRIHGAWLGRCAGCMVGKPVEGRLRDEIERLLEMAGEYPLQDYFPVIEDTGGVAYRPPADPCLRQNITCSVRDDDTDYTILGLHLVKTYGLELTPAGGCIW